MIQTMEEVTLMFETQPEADNAVLALSHTCKVEQWYVNTTSTGKPYWVKVYVPSEQIREVEE